MNIFMVAHKAGVEDIPALVSKLSCVPRENKQTNSVLVVDKCYNLPAGGEREPLAVRTCLLDDFLHEKSVVGGGGVVVDQNALAQKLNQVDESWLVIELGLHERGVALDFIKKLAGFTFLFPSLRDKNVVFLLPEVYLGMTAVYVNQAFNNVPGVQDNESLSHEINLLWVSTFVERLYMSSPLVAWPIAKARQVSRFFYNRLIRANG